MFHMDNITHGFNGSVDIRTSSQQISVMGFSNSARNCRSKFQEESPFTSTSTGMVSPSSLCVVNDVTLPTINILEIRKVIRGERSSGAFPSKCKNRRRTRWVLTSKRETKSNGPPAHQT